MDKALEEALKELSPLTAQLNTLSNSVTGRIAECEKALNDMRVGVPVFLASSFNADCGLWRGLGFCKVGNRWHIVGLRDKDPGLEPELVPLISAPREARVVALKLLPALVERIIVTVKAMITEIEGASTCEP